jgi:hypothetical protein
MIESNFYTIVPVLLMAAILPILCYQDWKNRELEGTYFWVYSLICTPLLIMQYFVIAGGYGWEEVAITGLLVLLYYLMQRLPVSRDYFHGDDMILMWLISVFCIVNPFHPDAGDLAVTTLIFLVPVMFSFFIFMFITTIYRHQSGLQSGKMTLIDVVADTGQRFPLVIPIAVAFYLAVVV